jgi:DNA polymerase-1
VAEVMNPDKPVGVLHLHIFLNSIKQYVEMYRPSKTIVCWDKRTDGAPNMRNAILPEYKEGRDKAKAALIHAHTDILEQMLDALGIVNFYPRTMEADDCIAYLCHELPGEKVVVSVDKDLLQLVNEDVVVYDPMKKVEINNATFDTYSKIPKKNFLIEKCMMGDRSDNIQGVKGYGPVKIKRYFAGEVKLTPEEQERLDRNMKMMSLDLYKDYPDEVEHFKNHPLVGNPSWETFEKLCKDNNMVNIAKNRAFYNLFFMEKTLENMFSNLFG